jgi:U3 small nucleolar RNA-associated protein 3
MGQKRKASSRFLTSTEPREVDPKDARLGPIETFADVADSEDEFHLNRDEVLLEDGPNEKRRKKWNQEGEQTQTKLLR